MCRRKGGIPTEKMTRAKTTTTLTRRGYENPEDFSLDASGCFRQSSAPSFFSSSRHDDEDDDGVVDDPQIFEEIVAPSVNESTKYVFQKKYVTTDSVEDFNYISNEEAKQLKLPNSTGLFNELFNEMKRYHKHNPEYESALKMTANEKRISFLNRYFIFKKVRVVNVDTIYMPNTKYQVAQEQVTKEELESAIQQEEQVFASIPPSALENNPRGIDNRPAWLVKQQEAAKAEIASEAPASEAPAPVAVSEAPASDAPVSEAPVSEAPASVVASEAQPSLPSPALKSDESIETKDKKGGQQVRRLKTKIILITI